MTRFLFRLSALTAALTFSLAGAGLAQTFTNPLFKGPDPWVTLVNGTYYYTESYCGTADICMKSSTTLSGLATAPWVGVWTHSSSDTLNKADIWAPEVHYVEGNWYIYYAADDGKNDDHHLFVLQAASSNPTGSYVEANTGLTGGELDESTGNWAIDPDVFIAGDGNLYITWSCTNQHSSAFPQRICLAPMNDPLHMSATVFLSTPTEYWETRGDAIQEGPVGYTRDGNTYITYSGSASFIPNDYAAGLLTNTTTNMLAAANWTKSGPILDHHGTAYGTGSVVFVPSIDGSEYWVLYHAYKADTGCSGSPDPCYRQVQMQQMFFDPVGYPVLGYPVNPAVSLLDPAGENGTPAGTTAIADFGNAWGDAAEGSTTAGLETGTWTYTNRFGATSSTGGAWDQIFSPWNPNPQNFVASVQVQLVATGKTQAFPKYGFYCSYDDTNNHAELFIDNHYKVLASHAVVAGKDQGWQNANLPAGFNASAWHSLSCTKVGSTYTFSLDSGAASYSRTFALTNGQTGLVVVDTKANYQNLQLKPCNTVDPSHPCP